MGKSRLWVYKASDGVLSVLFGLYVATVGRWKGFGIISLDMVSKRGLCMVDKKYQGLVPFM
jgi:hypothetical protein